MAWIKEKRLPLFLESDIYAEYRLAHILSQMEEAVDDNQVVVMKFDYAVSQGEADNEEMEVIF